MPPSPLPPLFFRPQSLVPGALYYRFQPDRLAPEQVWFASYRASPALVLVRNAAGERCLCPRDEIYEMKEFDHG